VYVVVSSTIGGGVVTCCVGTGVAVGGCVVVIGVGVDDVMCDGCVDCVAGIVDVYIANIVCGIVVYVVTGIDIGCFYVDVDDVDVVGCECVVGCVSVVDVDGIVAVVVVCVVVVDVGIGVGDGVW